MMVSSADIFISTAQEFLYCGNKKRRMPPSSCLDLAVQILAVDLGLKPALLYDCNAATAEQLLQYVNKLHNIGLLSSTLQIVSIDANTLVMNSKLMNSHLKELLQKRNLITVDVCHWKEQPSTISMESRTEDMIRTIVELFMDNKDTHSSVIVVGEELCAQWNLCTLFGILLGYPASYWFDQTQGFENCLSMTSLVVNKVWVNWQMGEKKHSSCLYSFSVPEVLNSEVFTHVEKWTELLKDTFSKQTVLTDLRFSKETVTLPCVSL